MIGFILPEGVQGELHRRTYRSWGVSFQNSMFEGTSHSRNDLRTVRVIDSGKMSTATRDVYKRQATQKRVAGNLP